MNTPKNQDEFLDLLDQAIFETRDLLFSAEHEGDEDDFGGFVPPLYEQPAKQLEQLHVDILAGRHAFGDGQDLAFMPFAKKWKDWLPMHPLLEAMNAAQKRGF